MSIYEISQRLANSISLELGYNEDKKEIVAYGIESVMLSLVGIATILIVALPLNVVFPTVIALIFGGGLRKVSGGAHFQTPMKCLTLGAVVYPLLGVMTVHIVKVDLYQTSVSVLVLVICLIIVALLAPVGCEAKPIHSSIFKRKLKLASVSIVVFACLVILLSNNTLINTGAVLGIVYQTITLLPIFNKKKKEV